MPVVVLNFKNFFKDIARVFRDYKTITLKDLMSIIGVLVSITILQYPYYYIKAGEYWAVWYDAFAIGVIYFLIFGFYHTKYYTQIMIIWFYLHLLITMIVFVSVYRWETGNGLYVVLLLLINYFISMKHKRLSQILSVVQFVFVGVFFYLMLVVYQGEKNAALDEFYDTHFLNSSIAVLFSALVFLIFYHDTIRRSFEQKEQDKELIRQISRTDFLTGLLNRRAMSDEISLKISSNRICVILCDIDYFKSVNDTYGHAVGDEAIKFVAKILTKNFRKDDLIARWGGEEFLIFCENLSKDELQDRVEKTRQMIRDESLNFSGLGIKISLTFGVVYCDKFSPNKINPLIKQADILLYEGKSGGRNQVVFKAIENV